jgi:biopolymer transport protein ExbD
MEKVMKQKLTPNINVTPLIDVLLVLLIIFMVISPTRPHRFAAKLPEKQQHDVIDKFSLVVSVSPSGYRLNMQQARTLAELSAQLHQALDGRPVDRKAVFLKAPRPLAYGEVVKVIDVIKEAGGAPLGLQLEHLDQ